MADSYEHAVKSSLPMNFPEGLRVLAVDANEVCLKLLVRLLEQCRYKVTSTRSPIEALKKLKKNKAKFDIVITDVKNLDMDGFSLLDIVVLEYDLPVIMISADDSNSTVMKGIRHGARDYLLKPVRLEEMKNIWQHVVRRSLTQPNNNSCIIKDETNAQSCPRKRQSKRLIWTVELHNKFVDAIEQLGNDAVPKQILGVMNEPGITRANVASHLQKFRKMLNNPKANQEGRITRASSHKRGGGSLSSIGNSSNQQMKTSDMHYCNTNAKNTVLNLQSDHFSMPESSFRHSEPILELSPLSQLPPLNQQDVLLQQQFSPAAPPPQLVDDQMMQPRRHNIIPTLEPLWIENYPPMQELNGLKLPFCSSEAGESSNDPPPITNPLIRSSYPSSLYDFVYRLVGADASTTRMIKTPQLSADHVPAQNFMIGKHEGGGNLFRGIISDELEGGFHFMTRSSSEDDFMTMVKQFGSSDDVNQGHFP